MYGRRDADGDFKFHEHITAATSEFSHDEHGRLTSSSGSETRANPFIPLGKMIPTLIIGADAERPRSELIRFTVSANVQPVVTLPGEDEVLDLKLTAADASEPLEEGDTDAPIGDPRSRSYITQSRGLQSLEYCIAVARANLVIRSRVVEISFRCKFERVLDVTLRKNAQIVDPRLPGGTATGKIISYSISLNGDDGQLNCSVTIGCAVGYGGTISETAGEAHYVDQDYVDDDYQEFAGAVKVIDGGVGSIGYPANVPGDFTADRGTGAAAATSASLTLLMVARSRPPTGRVRPNAKENGSGQSLG